ncbi:transcriptional regulator [Inquilinus limosus]|uniref:HVO_A0114 family putative DNA-binding protein n=1 Tax=Inquilinus limosus TaxID=171674 RepID=UPI003F15307A
MDGKTAFTTVTIGVASIEETKARLADAFQGRVQGARIDFASFDLLHRVLTPQRWALMQAMLGRGPLPVRDVARRVGRDVRAVERDIRALIEAGLIDRAEAGCVVCFFDALQLDVTLSAA